ncbi:MULTISPECIES: putative polysaccharide biosynthesis protein [Caproicibacterium]|uniref:Polysaccharide biosynthesis protein n=1 Tax=Caproicibacterium argilliputei TaxID=3030016 RepID=A0AA97D924_9FIRM|nr:polysaccharide biosynthesis protein [Caproicibacterium argilliputei]WOC31529.1 polysaccharide biosynthesis protein [Caproicibacterium argilliputei]
MARKSQSFLKGAAVLVGAVAVVKVLGALFKIPLSWILTPVGSAYFGSAYSLYFPIYSLAAAGFPTAVARMVSARCARGSFRDVRALHQVTVRLFTVIGFCAFALMTALSWPYANLAVRTGPQTVLPAVWALAPCALFCSLLSAYRGLYEGMRNMTPTAVSQVVEAAGRLIFGLGLCALTAAAAAREYALHGTVWGTPQPSEAYARLAALPACAAGAVFGVTIGSMLAFLYLIVYYHKNGDGITEAELRRAPPPAAAGTLRRELVRTAVPIALGSLAVNLSTLVDAALLNRRLSDLMLQMPNVLLQTYAGLLPQEVIRMQSVPSFLYGCYTNANTMFMLVPTVTQAFAMSALPSVTAAWAAGSRSRLETCVLSVLRLSAMITMPMGLGLSALAEPVCRLLFGAQNAPEITGQILAVLGIAAVFSALCTPVQSMLQAVGRVDLPVKFLFGGLAVKSVLNYVLVGDPRFQVMGAAVSTLVCYGAILVCSLAALHRETKLKLHLASLLGRPLLAGSLSAVTAKLCWRVLAPQAGSAGATCLAVCAAVVVYGICAALLGVITKEDRKSLFGGKSAKSLEKSRRIV